MKRDGQPAITKHPKGTASFCIRLCTHDGGTVEFVSTRPRPIAEVIASIESEYLGYMRNAQKAAAPDPADESTRMSVGEKA